MAVLALAGGCSTRADHPSLAPRAIERFTVAEPAPAPAPRAPLPQDASRQERAVALVAQARAADARFRVGLTEAEAAVARGAGTAPGSEAWVQAQQALSRTEALREPVSSSLSELDSLQVDAAVNSAGSEVETALAASLGEILAIDTRQREAMAALRQRIAQP